jgi:hypothetical protein
MIEYKKQFLSDEREKLVTGNFFNFSFNYERKVGELLEMSNK